ncbi:MAG: ATP-dependent RNA helicase DeaD [Marivirga sp.]
METYTHRSGRTGRAGKEGISIAIVGPRDTNKIKQLEKVLGKTFTKSEIPSGEEVTKKQLEAFIDKVKETPIDEKQMEKLMSGIEEQLVDLDRESLIKKFVSLQFNKFLEYYKNSEDINSAAKAGRDNESSGRGRKEGDFAKIFLNIGEKDNLTSGTLLGFMNNQSNMPRGVIFGKIDVQRSFTFLEVESKMQDTVINVLNGTSFDGRTVSAEAKSGGGPRSSGSSSGGGFKKRRSEGGSGGGSSRRTGGFKGRSGGSSGGDDSKSGSRPRVKASSGGRRR